MTPGAAGSSAGPLRRLARVAVTQPIVDPVPADDAAFFARKGVARLAFRILRRRAEVSISGQRRLQVERIEPAWRRAVWFHAEAPQIGDALMDLAPRSLLVERGIGVDLVAPASIAELFRGDRWFGRVESDPAFVTDGRYDFAIVDSHSRKALSAKRERAPDVPWVSVRGEYLAYDYQRAILATRRFAALGGVRLDRAGEARHARQKLVVAGSPLPAAEAPARVGIAVGGVRAERTYRHWPAVARALRSAGVSRFALFGSDNGVDAGRAVAEAIAGADVLDLVGRADLHGTQQAMARCTALLCADGGLLHLACTTPARVLGLFDASIDPAWRLPPDAATASLRAGVRDLSEIAPEAVASAALALMSTPDRPPEFDR